MTDTHDATKPTCPECGVPIAKLKKSVEHPPYVEPCRHFVGAMTRSEDGTLEVARSALYPGQRFEP